MQEAGHDFHLVIKMLTVLERHLCTISLQSFMLLLKLWVCKFISTTVLHLKFKHLTRASTYPFNLFFQPEVKGFKSYILRLRTHNSAPMGEWRNQTYRWVSKQTYQSNGKGKWWSIWPSTNRQQFHKSALQNQFKPVHCSAEGVRTLRRFLSCNKSHTKEVLPANKTSVTRTKCGLTQFTSKCKKRFYATAEFTSQTKDTLTINLSGDFTISFQRVI